MLEGLEKALRVPSMFDWIGELWALLDILFHWPVVGYRVPVGYIGPGKLRRLLRSHGLHPYGLRLGWNTISWGSKRGECWTTQAVLDANGIPFDGGRQFTRPPFLPGGPGMAQGQPTAPTAAPSVPVVGKEYNAQAAAQLAARRNARREG